MKAINQKELAGHLIVMRRTKGHVSAWEHHRRHPLRLIIFIAVMALIYALGEKFELSGLSGGVLGIIMGVFARDSAYARRSESSWEVFERFIDWNEVEKCENEP